MNDNLLNKKYLGRKDNIEKNHDKTSHKEVEMLMNLWDSGTDEERIKLAHALLNMARELEY